MTQERREEAASNLTFLLLTPHGSKRYKVFGGL